VDCFLVGYMPKNARFGNEATFVAWQYLFIYLVHIRDLFGSYLRQVLSL
jgi:hypothetical protein